MRLPFTALLIFPTIAASSFELTAEPAAPLEGEPITITVTANNPWSVSQDQFIRSEIDAGIVRIVTTADRLPPLIDFSTSYDVVIGALPAGEYDVILVFDPDPQIPPFASLSLTVSPIRPVPALSATGVGALIALFVIFCGFVLKRRKISNDV